MFDATVYNVRLDGGLVVAGDWLVFVRMDRHSSCANAITAGIAGNDHGGLVQQHTGGYAYVNVMLDGDVDGMVDPTPHDGSFNLTSYRGEQTSSTYVLCHASAAANSRTAPPAAPELPSEL